MKPQANIQTISDIDKEYFTISVEENGQIKQLSQQFLTYADCLTFISDKDWQVKREAPSSLHIPTQFMKP